MPDSEELLMNDLISLSTLLNSPEARRAAACVPVSGSYLLTRCGVLFRARPYDWPEHFVATGQPGRGITYSCIWSGNLPELMAQAFVSHETSSDFINTKDNSIRELEQHLELLQEALFLYGDRSSMAKAPAHLQEAIDQAMAIGFNKTTKQC